MLTLGTPSTQPEITAALEAEVKAIHQFFSELPLEQFFSAPAEVWSAGDNLVHLIKSISPLARGLALPKMALGMRFGKAKRPSQTFAQIRQIYIDAVNDGTAVASGSFLPEVNEETAEERERILAKWEEKGNALVETLANWSEKHLDKYQVPHPIIGDLTVREMLFFTLYHNMHHVKDVQRLLSLPEAEWFAG